MRTTILLVTLMMAAAACATGTTGEYPWPVFITTIESVAPPAGVVESGAEADFAVTWANGRDPFVVKWEFEGGTEQEAYTLETQERSSVISLIKTGATTKKVL